MSIEVKEFGKLDDKTAHVIKITNDDGSFAEFTDYGAALKSLYIKNGSGALVNVALGYDTFAEYVENDGTLGAVVGRFANRIGKAEFSLNGKTYKLYANDNGNTLHGGKKGFDRYIWDYEIKKDSVVFSRISQDGEEGFPGTLKVSVKYTFEQDCLKIVYKAISDADTILNLSNHSYFNLNGTGSILGHKLKLRCSNFTELDDNTLPTGKILPVKGTALDFTEFKEIGQDINEDEPKRFRGYDHNFVIDSPGKSIPFAEAESENGSLKMECYTDQPGVQLYTANFLSKRSCTGGQTDEHEAFCLETQHFPDSPNNANFPSTVLKAEEEFSSFTIFKFSRRQI